MELMHFPLENGLSVEQLYKFTLGYIDQHGKQVVRNFFVTTSCTINCMHDQLYYFSPKSTALIAGMVYLTREIIVTMWGWT